MSIRPGRAKGPWVGTSGTGGGGGVGSPELTFQLSPSQMNPATLGGSAVRDTIRIQDPGGNGAGPHYETIRFPFIPNGTLDEDIGRCNIPLTLYPAAPVPTQWKVKLYYTQIATGVAANTIDWRFNVLNLNDGDNLYSVNTLVVINNPIGNQYCLKTFESGWNNILLGPATENSLLNCRLWRGEDTFIYDVHLLKMRIQLRP